MCHGANSHCLCARIYVKTGNLCKLSPMTATPPLVLHVIHQLGIGGLENGLVNLINGMPESRFRHAIACIEDYSDFRQRLKRSDVEVFALHRSSIGVWALRKELF